MTGKAVTFISIKGGVGKTTILVNTANELAEKAGGGDKVLIIDLDAQAGSSLYVLGHERLREFEKKDRTLYHLMQARLLKEKVNIEEKEEINIEDYVSPAGGEWSGRLHVLPGSAKILELEQELMARRGAWLLELRSLVEHFKTEGYRYVFVDPPASFTVLSRAALASCNYFLVPVIPDEFGLNALEFFRSEIFNNTVYELAKLAEALNVKIELPLCGGVFFNRVKSTSRYHSRMRESIAREAKKIRLYNKYLIPVYESILHDYVDYAKALEEHAPAKRLKNKEIKEELKKFFDEFYEYVINDKVKKLG